MTTHRPIVVWLEQDLRLHDNPALLHAAKQGPVVVVYVLDEHTPGRWAPGGASRWWLHHSLLALQKTLSAHRVPLVLRRGDAARIIPALARKTNARAVVWNRRYEPFRIPRDTAIKTALTHAGVEAHSFNASLLVEPWEVAPTTGAYFKVFTPFWRACLRTHAPEAPLPAPSLKPYTGAVASDALASWRLLPTTPDWAGGFRASWQPGEAGAEARLHAFLDQGLRGYAAGRDTPAAAHTSRLSPHLHWGEISPRRVWHAVHTRMASGACASSDAEKFLAELGWREFSYHLLFHAPTLPEAPFRAEFAHFPWEENAAHLAAWQRGRTGYPIVDAGMRELWHTGTMHNRVRMIVASFLTKHLRIAWQHGAAWFWDTLVDADLASNSASWQWVAGCGADAAPYFRIFNPILQGQKFDPEGTYVRRWVPELAALSPAEIHAPWRLPQPPKAYPAPLVNHEQARASALAAYRILRA